MKLEIKVREDSVPAILQRTKSVIQEYKPADMKEDHWKDSLEKEINKAIEVLAIVEMIKQVR